MAIEAICWDRRLYDEVAPAQVRYRVPGQAGAEPIPLIREHVLDIFLNDTYLMPVTCLPEWLPELVLGRLMTEGLICGLDGSVELYLCEGDRLAKVYQKGGAAGPAPLRPLPALRWTEEQIWALSDRFQQDLPLHRLTHATHGCYLSRNGEILFQAEDTGRHNAVDKAVGWAARNQVPLEECILFTTGRTPVSMVRKLIHARIPVLVSKESPTVEGVELARQYGLTLIGNVKGGRMCVYSAPSRVACQDRPRVNC